MNGDTPCSRAETRSPGSTVRGGTSSVEGVPASKWPGLRRAAATSRQLTAVPARSARNSAVQWTIRAPADLAPSRSRAVAGTTPAASAAAASSGKELRSPMTPRWTSMVRTAQRSGAASCVRSTGTEPRDPGSPTQACSTRRVSALGPRRSRGGRAVATDVRLCRGLAHHLGRPSVVGLAAR